MEQVRLHVQRLIRETERGSMYTPDKIEILANTFVDDMLTWVSEEVLDSMQPLKLLANYILWERIFSQNLGQDERRNILLSSLDVIILLSQSEPRLPDNVTKIFSRPKGGTNRVH